MYSLRDLALKYKTDKAGGRDNQNNHEYCEAYEFFLKDLRDKQFSMLEIGIGGYEFPDRGGESLRMWSEYFPYAQIFALDLHKKDFKVDRVHIVQGNQTDSAIAELFGTKAFSYGCEFIVDDASHINPLTLKTFEIYWPYLAPGGVYAIEDCHTSYWPRIYEGGEHGNTVMNFFKRQLDYLNYPHSLIPADVYEHYLLKDIESIHFFKEIIFIRKKA